MRLRPEVRTLSAAYPSRHFWFLRRKEFARCGPAELRAFFAYLNNAHQNPEGRWGDPRYQRELRPAAAKFYYARLQTFFNFLVQEGAVPASPMARFKAPIVRQDKVAVRMPWDTGNRRLAPQKHAAPTTFAPVGTDGEAEPSQRPQDPWQARS